MSAKPNNLPWRVETVDLDGDTGLYIADDFGESVCDLYFRGRFGSGKEYLHQFPHAKEHAEFICRAVNSHDELLAALEELTAACEREFCSPELASEPDDASVFAHVSDTHAITDDAILAAWGGADGMDAERRAETAAMLRSLVEMDDDRPAVFGESVANPEGYACHVGALREKLGGWPAVWRAVLVDEGFEPLREPPNAWELGLTRAGLVLRVGPDGWELVVAGLKDSIPLRSPAHLRELVGHAKGLFGE